MVRVLICDAQAIVREGLAAVISRDDRFLLVGEAFSCDSLPSVLRSSSADLLIFDPSLVAHDLVSFLRELKRSFPSARVLFFSANPTEEEVYRSLRAGAEGFLSKAADTESVTTAMMAVINGERYICPRAAALFARRLRRPELSEQELAILRLLASGHDTESLATREGLSISAVKTHMHAIFSKLQVHDRLAAVLCALERGHLHR